MSSADDQYEQTNDQVSGNAPAGNPTDDEYTMRQTQKGGPVPVQSDNANVEDPIDPATADSDQTLARDESEAIDKSNIIDERTRGAKPKGVYTEPGDEEGLGGPDDGVSRVSGGPS